MILLAALAWTEEKIYKSDAEWRKTLSIEQFRILRRKETERPFSGKYLFTWAPGIYHCAACDLPLLNSEDKYSTSSGWASFTKPIAPKNVYYLPDSKPYVQRYEVLCGRCDSHLGHVFHDGPPPKMLRYCINSTSLTLKKSH